MQAVASSMIINYFFNTTKQQKAQRHKGAKNVLESMNKAVYNGEDTFLNTHTFILMIFAAFAPFAASLR
jgi:hypothetical protein